MTVNITRSGQAVAAELHRTRRPRVASGHICYLCGAPATVQISADTPIGCNFPPVHYEQHDGVMLLTAYSCTEHMVGRGRGPAAPGDPAPVTHETAPATLA